MIFKIKRYISWIVDYFFSLSILIFFCFLFDFELTLWKIIFLAVIDNSWTVFKDYIFFGRSLGKRVAGLAIVSTNGEKVTGRQLILRNVTLLLFPLTEMDEVRAGEIRRGDRLAGTAVEEISKSYR